MPVHANWWEHFFTGVSVDLWLQAVSPEHTASEAAVLTRVLAAPAGAELLDVPCGGGRLSLALAAQGYRLTGVDISPEFLAHARACDGADRVAWEQREMRDLPWPARFDGAFCLGNSFGYLDDQGNTAFLRAVAAALKPGARFILETPMVLENLLGHLQDRPWWQIGDQRLLVVNQYDHTTGRLEIEYTFVANGRVEVRRGSHQVFTYRDVVNRLEDAGFTVEVAQPWRREAHTVTFIATR
ncbi:MAG: methyltransferase domain-containing protein [Acidobacteriota bacterium]